MIGGFGSLGYSVSRGTEKTSGKLVSSRFIFGTVAETGGAGTISGAKKVHLILAQHYKKTYL